MTEHWFSHLLSVFERLLNKNTVKSSPVAIKYLSKMSAADLHRLLGQRVRDDATLNLLTVIVSYHKI
jgi:hypothetical protein